MLSRRGSDTNTLRVDRVLTGRADSPVTAVLSLKMFFIAHRAHAVCAGAPVESAAGGAKHRRLAVVSFLSHVSLLHTWN